jgi:hypothetical protein
MNSSNEDEEDDELLELGERLYVRILPFFSFLTFIHFDFGLRHLNNKNFSRFPIVLNVN